MENYWKQMYGERSKDFVEGVIAGVTALAINKNGGQFVGIMETPLEIAIKEIKEGLGWKED